MEDEQHLLDDNHDDQVQIMTNGTMVSVERELAEKLVRSGRAQEGCNSSR